MFYRRNVPNGGECAKWLDYEKEEFFDAQMRAARASAVLSVLLTGLAMLMVHGLLLFHIPSPRIKTTYWNCVRFLFLLAMMFQLLTFLAFAAWLCDNMGYDTEVCTIESGGILAAMNACVLFIVMIIICRNPPPIKPVVEQRQTWKSLVIFLVAFLGLAGLLAVVLALTLPKANGDDLWPQQRGQVLVGDNQCDTFGTSLSLSADGHTLAVAATTTDYYRPDNPGYTHVYQYVDEEWVQKGSAIQSHGAHISLSLSADGKRLAVGSAENTAVYQVTNDGWSQLGSDIEDGSSTEIVAVALSADSSTLAVGVPLTNSASLDVGLVRVYRLVEGQRVQMGSNIPGDNERKWVPDNFGASLSLSEDGNVLAVGANNRASVFKWDNGSETWIQVGSDIVQETEPTLWGHLVSLSASGTSLAVGGRIMDHACVYELTDQQWTQNVCVRAKRAVGPSSWARGMRVALSADGTTLVVGAV